jgi:hypothetical protein
MSVAKLRPSPWKALLLKVSRPAEPTTIPPPRAVRDAPILGDGERNPYRDSAKVEAGRWSPSATAALVCLIAILGFTVGTVYVDLRDSAPTVEYR